VSDKERILFPAATVDSVFPPFHFGCRQLSSIIYSVVVKCLICIDAQVREQFLFSILVNKAFYVHSAYL